MPYYVKVTPQVRDKILPAYTVKPQAKDGNYLLFQKDLIGLKGNTLSERVKNVGGALLTPAQCKAERDGTVEAPAYCYTPEEYGGEPQSQSFMPGEQGQPSSEVTQKIQIPKVEGTSCGDSPEAKVEGKTESEVSDE